MKPILKLFTFSTIFILFACSEDFYENVINKNDLKVSHKKFENLLKDKKFSKVLTEVIVNKNKISSNSKTIMEQQCGFNITNKPVNVIENDSITSYTLFVTRENTTSNVVENLIIQTNNNNPYDTKAFLIKYTSNVDINENFEMSNFQGTKSILPIIYNISESDTTGKLVYVETCWNVTSWYCYGPGGHSSSDGCTMGFPITSQNCMTTSYDDGTGSGGGGGGTSSGNSGSSSDDVFTAPHGGGGSGSELTPPDPCVNLKKHLSTTTGIKLKSPQILSYLTGQLSQTKEYGFYFKKENNVYTPYQSYNATTDKITIKIGGSFFCSIHTHPYPTSNPMFSWEDVFSLQQYFQFVNTDLEEEVTIFLVCKDGYGTNQLYALKVDDFSTFADFLINDIANTVTTQHLAGLTTEADRNAEIIKRMNVKQHKYNLNNPNINQEVPFLNYFAGSGASLYKANSTLTNWDKLTLSNNTANPITNTPCN